MSIKFNYEIISVDEAARCMEVKYAADGYATMHISARLPFVDESLEAVILSYAPIQLWEDSVKPVAPPTAGQTGELTPPALVISDMPGFVEQTIS